jgi:penicillin-binding protein 2
VENAGFGATYAAPVASLIIEKYLKGEISEANKWQEQRILELNLINKLPAIETEH